MASIAAEKPSLEFAVAVILRLYFSLPPNTTMIIIIVITISSPSPSCSPTFAPFRYPLRLESVQHYAIRWTEVNFGARVEWTT